MPALSPKCLPPGPGQGQCRYPRRCGGRRYGCRRLQETAMSIIEWRASWSSIWSKNPTPVAISRAPVPSRSTSTVDLGLGGLAADARRCAWASCPSSCIAPRYRAAGPGGPAKPAELVSGQRVRKGMRTSAAPKAAQQRKTAGPMEGPAGLSNWSGR